MAGRLVLGTTKLKRVFVQSLIVFLVLFVASAHSGGEGQPKKKTATKVTYRDQVRPLFVKHCLSCHNSTTSKGDLDLSRYKSALAGGSSGEVLVAGDPGQSRLYRLVNHLERPHMPLRRPKLAVKQLRILRTWIADGLLEDPGSKPKVSLRRSVLAFRMPARKVPKRLATLDWPVRKPQRFRRANSVVALAAHPWRPWFAVGGHKQVLLFHTASLKLIGSLPFPVNGPASLRFSPDGKFLSGFGGRGGESGVVVIWNASSGRTEYFFEGEEDTILDGAFHPGQRLLVFASAERVIPRHRSVLLKQKVVAAPPLKGHADWISAMAMDASGKWLASADRRGAVYIWDLQRGERAFVLRGHRGPVTSVSWRRDSKVLASSSDDGSIRLWSAATGKLVRGIDTHEKGVLDVEFMHDGRFVSCGRDRRVRIWDEAGGSLATVKPVADIVTRVAVGHEGKMIIGGDFLGNVYVWDVKGKVLGRTSSNPGE